MVNTDDLQLGAIGFSTSAGFISAAIRWFTRSEWSHCFIVLDTDALTGRREILEASQWGVQRDFLDKYQGAGDRVRLYNVDVSDDSTLMPTLEACLNLVGRSYGYLQLLGYVPVLALNRVGIKIKNPITAGRVCSELLLRYLQLRDLDPRFAAMDRDTASPEDLFKVVRNHPSFHLCASL